MPRLTEHQWYRYINNRKCKFFYTVISCISNKHEQEGYQIYSKIEQLLLNGGQEVESEGDKG